MAAVSDCCDNLRRRPKLLKVLDIVLILFVLHPCMVLYWRGIWDLWGVYVNPKPFPANQWKILCVSCSTIFGYFIGPKLNEYTINKSRAQQVVTVRIFLWIYGALFMGYWRGVWETASYYVDDDVLYASLVLSVPYCLLLLFRASRTCIIPPMLVNLDTTHSVLIPRTRFSTTVNQKVLYLFTRTCMVIVFFTN